MGIQKAACGRSENGVVLFDSDWAREKEYVSNPTKHIEKKYKENVKHYEKNIIKASDLFRLYKMQSGNLDRMLELQKDYYKYGARSNSSMFQLKSFTKGMNFRNINDLEAAIGKSQNDLYSIQLQLFLNTAVQTNDSLFGEIGMATVSGNLFTTSYMGTLESKFRSNKKYRDIINAEDRRRVKEGVRQGLSVGVDFIPVASQIKSAVELLSGRDYIAGDDIGTFGRTVTAAGILLPVAKQFKHVGVVDEIFEGIGKAEIGLNRTEALNKAKDWIGVPRSQQASRQWTVGDDITKKGANYKNYEYSDNPTHHGRYYEYESPQGKRVVVDHTNDIEQGLHTHAGTPPKGADPFKYDFKNTNNRYYPVNKDTNHHIPYFR